MIIHVVQEGETTASIAEKYGISEERLILENEIQIPVKLAIGETLVILYPEITHIVQEGDSLESIATQYGVTVMQLLRNNAYLSDRQYIYPGETIVIKYTDEKTYTLTTNGYVYPFVQLDTLQKTLPYLTYITIFSYTITADGEIQDIDDEAIIQMSKAYGVAPIMMVTGPTESQTEDIRIAHNIINSPDLQDRLITNILSILRKKGYYGININTPYIYPEDRLRYILFIGTLTEVLSREGYRVLVTLSLSNFELLTRTINKGFDYGRLGQIVNDTMLISYEWGISLGIPSGIIPYDTIKYFLSQMTQVIPPEKIHIGIPCIGYVWNLPYEPGVTKGTSVSYQSAVALARETGIAIEFDDVAKTAYYQYIYIDEYVVRFRDARSIDAFVKLVPEFGLNGFGIWNVMIFFPQMWLVINSQYEITKVL